MACSSKLETTGFEIQTTDIRLGRSQPIDLEAPGLQIFGLITLLLVINYGLLG